MDHYNIKYSFNTILREVPENKEQTLAYVQKRKKELESIKKPLERTKFLGEIGSYLRILEDLEQAEVFLNEAIALIDEHDLGIKYEVQNGIRLAHIYQWQGRLELAGNKFYNLKEMCELKKEVSGYLHFVLQHIGKFYFQLASFEKALDYFKNALQLREKLGDQSLVDRSKYAIATTIRAVEERSSTILPPLSFLGLSPNDAHEIIYSPFSLKNRIFNFENTNLDETQKIPFVAQAIYFLNKLKNDGFIKATKKGNLSRAFVIEVYNEFFSNEEYARLPHREDDLIPLTRLKHILDMAGLIKKRRGKFTLTKKGEKLVDKENYLELFRILTDVFFNKWNWAYADGYSELPLIQQTAVFNIYLLNKTAQDWILDQELGQCYLEAFPMLVNEVTNAYFGPEQEIIQCFCTRFLKRTCLPLSFLETREIGQGFDRKKFYRVTPLFKSIFSFNL